MLIKESKSSRLINLKATEDIPYGPTTAKENLPLPYVHYPSIYGTFISFSSEIDSERYLCECSIPAMENYLLIEGKPLSVLDKRFESDCSIPIDINKPFNLSSFKFEKKICHRCNLATPSARYCHEMYGSKFKQFYGWYINQNAFKFGIGHFMYKQRILIDKSPDELKILLSEKEELDSQFMQLDSKVLERHSIWLHNFFSPSYEINDYERRIIAKSYELSKLLQKNKRKIENLLENATRQEFGFSKIGESWLAESILYNIIKRLFKNYEIIRHYRPDWLHRLELDIFIPDLSLGIEYQGQQHYKPIRVWGGQKSYNDLVRRDKVKKELCLINNVLLIEINYTEPLIESYIREKIAKYLK